MAAKLPEVGEFWEWTDRPDKRFRVVYVSRDKKCCCVEYKDEGCSAWFLAAMIDRIKYLPWCKSFTDVEPPKPEMETVVFHEVWIDIGPERVLHWTTKPADETRKTGRTETRELPKR